MEDARVAELRKAVRHQLQQAGVQNVLHNLLQEYQRTGEVVTPDDALDILQVRPPLAPATFTRTHNRGRVPHLGYLVTSRSGHLEI